MKKVLNIVSDEKFIDRVISNQDLFAGMSHDYFLVSDIIRQEYEFKYIKECQERVKVTNSKLLIQAISSGKYHAIFLHSLYALPLSLIYRIPYDVKVFWFAWGFDIYRNEGFSLINKPLLHERTYRCKRRIVFKRNKFKTIAKYFFGFIPQIKRDYQYKKAISRIDFFSGVVPVEYDLCKKNPIFKAKQVFYEYSSNKVFEAPSDRQLGNVVIIGNSADYTNNHLDLFEYMKGLSFEKKEIVLPLNYSGTNDYINIVSNEARELFGDNCTVLKDFVPLAEYNRIMDRCGVGIFFHERQQAMGNITGLIRRGCKVFLSETSVIYHYLKELGVAVYSVQSELNQKELDNELDYNTKINNYRIITSGTGKDYIVKMLSELSTNI